MTGPLITVVIPTYNRRRYLPEALASAVRQSYRRLEIFVVNDGGEDVGDIVRSFNDPRITFIDRKVNRGKAFSLNEALMRARGKYVAYLDDDDVYYPGHIATLVGALEDGIDCGVAYSDLYKVYCEALPDGRRQVLSKYVEISRDFDRFLMLYFNHVLHVCLMHRRDLLDKTGLYNENVNVLIDWDMTRRLAFYSDFRHVPAITGEFFSPVGPSDRISVQRRRDSQEYLRNILMIRTTRPPKPWPKMKDLSVILLVEQLDDRTADTMLRIWRHTFHPYRLHVPLPATQAARLNVEMPNVEAVPVGESSSPAERLDAALRRCEGEYVAILPSGAPVEEMWVEHPVGALMSSTRPEGFLLEGAGSQPWAAVLRRTDLEDARRTFAHLSIEASLAAGGVDLRQARPDELPFQFDDLLLQAKLAEADGDWATAARLFTHMSERFQNELWMKAMAARAYFKADDYEKAGLLSHEVNRLRPTVDTLLLEARVCRQRRKFKEAIRLLWQAEQALGGAPDTPDRAPVQYSHSVLRPRD